MTMDYIDASNFVVEDAESDIDENDEVMVRKTRGKDIDWEEIEVFINPVEFKQSNLKKEIDEFMSRKKTWNTELVWNENYFGKRKGAMNLAKNNINIVIFQQVCILQFFVMVKNIFMKRILNFLLKLIIIGLNLKQRL